MRIITVLFIFSSLLGCATATPYQPDTHGEGFKDLKIESNKFRVSFKGNSITPRDTVETYLLYRSAELTKENNFDYFVIREQQVDVKSDYFSTGSPMFGMYGGYGRRRYPYYASGYSWAQQGSMQSQDRYQAFAYITMYKAEPSDKPEAYHAEEVLKNLGPNIVRPKK